MAEQVLEGKKEVSGRAAVLGTGNTGCEVAHFLLNRGLTVTLVGDEPMGQGLEPSTGKVLARQFQERGVKAITGVQVASIEKGTVRYRDAEGRAGALQADWVVLAGEAQPSDELETGLGSLRLEVRPLPYCGQPRLALRAGREGAETARQI